MPSLETICMPFFNDVHLHIFDLITTLYISSNNGIP